MTIPNRFHGGILKLLGHIRQLRGYEARTALGVASSLSRIHRVLKCVEFGLHAVYTPSWRVA